MAKFLASMIVVIALLAGGAMYYVQVYAYYIEVPITGTDDVQLVSVVTDLPEPIDYADFEAIDATSSPIRYRACFTTNFSLATLTESYVVLEDKAPRNGPGWFGCFDAAAIGAELEAGTALTFLGQKNVGFGVDRIVAVTEDGRGYVWHDLNDCGEKAYDGTIVGEDCPDRPEPETN